MVPTTRNITAPATPGWRWRRNQYNIRWRQNQYNNKVTPDNPGDLIIFKLILVIVGQDISSEITLTQMSLELVGSGNGLVLSGSMA